MLREVPMGIYSSLTESIASRNNNVTKFNPRCDSDKQTIPWATSLRVVYGTTAPVSSCTAINLAIRWPL